MAHTRHTITNIKGKGKNQEYVLQGVHEKLWFFSQFTETPPSPTSLKEPFKALILMRVYSHFYGLVVFCTTNHSQVLARERWQTFENSWKKTIFNEHRPVSRKIFIHVQTFFGRDCRRSQSDQF